jgi:hypothetical protein
MQQLSAQQQQQLRAQ